VSARVLFVFGTRPEAVKLAPVIRRVADTPGLKARVCLTAQHREMVDSILAWFEIKPDHDLDVMRPGQDLPDLTARVLSGLTPVLAAERPDLVMVQGDTTSSTAAALAAFYHRIPVGHVEAGLRTHRRDAPFPEEINRRLTGVLADLHFAPTARARDNLLSEGIDPAMVHVTGNTVVDALLDTVARVEGAEDSTLARARADLDAATDGGRRRLILVTGHRRESFGKGFAEICAALAELAGRYPDAAIVYPVHLNPNVQEPVRRTLSGLPNIHLWPPLDYLPFVEAMRRAYLILTDSGGVQEEAPSLGVPVLVMREVTERAEGVDAGVVRLVGTSRARIVAEAAALLDDPGARDRWGRVPNPYGDGHAAERIAAVVATRTAGG
jgi:UDP-N-acetylglucosamine 2-epimerase (non-hydrolysing)